MSVVKASVRGERGSATVLWISIIMICVLVGLVAFALTEFASARARVAGAADLAAIAAANRALDSDGCQRAARIATANDATLRTCRVEGTEATVVVEGRARGALARIAAAAGRSAPKIVVNAHAGQPESVT